MAKGAKARAAARKQRDKWKSKRWFTIRAPRNPWSFRIIGETIAEESEQLVGRTFDIMQNELDGDFSKMHVQVIFRITDVVGGDALTEFALRCGLVAAVDLPAKIFEAVAAFDVPFAEVTRVITGVAEALSPVRVFSA